MKRILGLMVILALCSSGGVHAFGKKNKKDKELEVDHVALASVLIKDGHFDRAEAVLKEVDPNDEELELDRPRYFMLFGLIYLEQQRHPEAQKAFEQSKAAGQKEPVLHVFLAQALFGQGKYEQTVKALDAAGEAAREIPGTFLIRAQSHWKMGDKSAAFEDLEKGLGRYPDNREIMRFKVFSLVEMGLFQEALVEGRAYLEHEKALVDDYIALGEALTKGNDAKSATLLLEEARLRYPESTTVYAQLGRAYLKAGRTLTAARIFHELSREDPKLVLDAAELYRRAGKLSMALALNSQVTDQSSKVRQRLGILIEQERYEEAAGLEERLGRLGLLAEDAVRYALAFALFETGKYEKSERHLSAITDAELFQKAAQLRRAMERCEAAGWECR